MSAFLYVRVRTNREKIVTRGQVHLLTNSLCQIIIKVFHSEISTFGLTIMSKTKRGFLAELTVEGNA